MCVCVGRHAYSSNVQQSGLWNSDFIDSVPLTSSGLARFEDLVGTNYSDHKLLRQDGEESEESEFEQLAKILGELAETCELQLVAQDAHCQ